ncbi:polysaccharide biosynthesis/export family protein [Consotaella aegiceratis]|uniref:polysaccharide biosynthesis/export family protein n=1 Tax=Consotaella aegiceratis TaxID=3097961 RepID=UPI002F3FC43E
MHNQYAKVGLSLAAASLLAGCAALPRQGPSDESIRREATIQFVTPHSEITNYNYALIDLTKYVVDALDTKATTNVFKSFGGGKGAAPVITIGVGDVIQVTVYESQSGGLFIPEEAGSRPGNYVTFPAQTVGRNGYITVPYAGTIRVVGRSPSDVEAEIVSKLLDRAIQPQVTVSVIDQKAASASVVGDVNAPNTFAVSAGGDTVLDMIARAGGLKYDGYDSFVTLQRRGRSATIAFDRLVQAPSENIYVAPGDKVYVYREQKKFYAFGASGENGSFAFGKSEINLVDAVGLAGSFLDDRTDPGQVFVYRLEDRSVLEGMGIETSKLKPYASKVDGKIPTVYHANFREPEIYFLAQEFHMEPDDILYVTNADAVEVGKFLTMVNMVSQPVVSVVNTTN